MARLAQYRGAFMDSERPAHQQRQHARSGVAGISLREVQVQAFDKRPCHLATGLADAREFIEAIEDQDDRIAGGKSLERVATELRVESCECLHGRKGVALKIQHVQWDIEHPSSTCLRGRPHCRKRGLAAPGLPADDADRIGRVSCFKPRVDMLLQIDENRPFAV